MAITGDQRLLKRINRMAIVRLVRARPGLSRADLAVETGLTKSTVSLLVQELVEEGWLREEDVLVTGAIGRRPTPLRLDGSRLALVGAELEVGNLIVLGMSLDGRVLEERRQAFAQDEAPGVVLERLAAMIAELAAILKGQGRSVLGTGVALPGAVLESEGMLMAAPNLGWRKVPVRAELQRALDARGWQEMPLFVRNDCDVAALGEIEFSPGSTGDPLLFIGLGIGVGSGMVVGGRLLVGQRGFAGEIGHIQLQPDGPQCTCGRRGCAEAYMGLAAVASSLGCSSSEVFERVRDTDEDVRKVLELAGQRLGVLMHNLWTTLDPALIVLGGSGCGLGPVFLDAARHGFEALALSAGIDVPEVRLAKFGAHAVPAGAAALVLHKLLLPL